MAPPFRKLDVIYEPAPAATFLPLRDQPQLLLAPLVDLWRDGLKRLP